MKFWSEVGGSLPTLDFDQVDPDIIVVIILIGVVQAWVGHKVTFLTPP